MPWSTAFLESSSWLTYCEEFASVFWFFHPVARETYQICAWISHAFLAVSSLLCYYKLHEFFAGISWSVLQQSLRFFLPLCKTGLPDTFETRSVDFGQSREAHIACHGSIICYQSQKSQFWVCSSLVRSSLPGQLLSCQARTDYPCRTYWWFGCITAPHLWLCAFRMG